jgi:hypothetical protein
MILGSTPAGKAALFHNFDVYDQITITDNPKDIKALGRAVRNYDDVIWKNNAREIVLRGNVAKFTQKSELRDYIINTGERKFVEGAWYDPVWGVALSWDDPLIESSLNWRGTNWLGETLDKVREYIRATLE